MNAAVSLDHAAGVVTKHGVVAMTVREQLVMAKALAYAIRVIEGLPLRWQEWSDKEDMKALLSRMGVFTEIAIQSAQHHMDGAQSNVNTPVEGEEEKAHDNGAV
jgi:hypothetical protein